MSSRVWLSFYSLVMWALQPLVVRKLRRRSRDEPLYGQDIPERWGHYATPGGQGFVWVHAVSLGETRVAALLLPHLRTKWPGMPGHFVRRCGNNSAATRVSPRDTACTHTKP